VTALNGREKSNLNLKLKEYLDGGQAELVPPNKPHAHRLLTEAQKHIGSARQLADQGDDDAGAFAMLYDAARKGMGAALAASGVRIKARGGHWAGRVLLTSAYPGLADVFAEHAWLQQVRNRTEYPDFGDAKVSKSELEEAFVVVPQILDASAAAVEQPISWIDDIISP